MTDPAYRVALFEELEKKLIVLCRRVAWLKKNQPERHPRHEKTKLLAAVIKVIEASSRNPSSPEYRLGNTLGTEQRHWRRCKEGLPPRYRLFFQFSSERLICVYVWLNDEKTLRKEGARTDVYATFKRQLERKVIPSVFVDLLRRSTYWPSAEEFLKTI